MKTFLLRAITGAVLLLFGVMVYLRLGLAEVRGDLAKDEFVAILIVRFRSI